MASDRRAAQSLHAQGVRQRRRPRRAMVSTVLEDSVTRDRGRDRRTSTSRPAISSSHGALIERIRAARSATLDHRLRAPSSRGVGDRRRREPARVASRPHRIDRADRSARGRTKSRHEEYDPEIAAIFSEEATELLEAADVAAAAAGTRRAATRSSRSSCKRQLHTLKGGARMAGIDAMGDLSARARDAGDPDRCRRDPRATTPRTRSCRRASTS